MRLAVTKNLTKLADGAPIRKTYHIVVTILAIVLPAQAATADWQHAIGRLNLAGFDWQQHCTGTLITPSAVLTAAHCVYVQSRDRWAKPSEINFLAGYDRGTYVTHLRAARVVRAGSLRSSRRLSLADAAMDWAIIITRNPAPASISPIPLRTEAVDPPLVAAGYVRGRAHILSRNAECRIHAGAPGSQLIAHTCPLGPGASGGPLIARGPAGKRVVGVQTGRSGSTGYAIPARIFAQEVVAALGPSSVRGNAGPTSSSSDGVER